MRMPGMNGVQLPEAVGRSWPRTARLLLTGQADLGAYITKPWNDDERVLTLRQVAQGQQVEAEKAALERLTHRQNEELMTLNLELEARVTLRTAELAAVNDWLERNYLTSIKAFTALIDLRGSAQFGHARQVADLTRRIAQAMTVEAVTAHDLPIAALLHDIGHIGLSDAVLARPVNRLNRDELQRYRLHPVLGEQALLASDDMQGVAPLIRHERWDGQGFRTACAGRRSRSGPASWQWPMPLRICAGAGSTAARWASSKRARSCRPAAAAASTRRWSTPSTSCSRPHRPGRPGRHCAWAARTCAPASRWRRISCRLRACCCCRPDRN